jgi:hypothetical protein
LDLNRRRGLCQQTPELDPETHHELPRLNLSSNCCLVQGWVHTTSSLKEDAVCLTLGLESEWDRTKPHSIQADFHCGSRRLC